MKTEMIVTQSIAADSEAEIEIALPPEDDGGSWMPVGFGVYQDRRGIVREYLWARKLPDEAA